MTDRTLAANGPTRRLTVQKRAVCGASLIVLAATLGPGAKRVSSTTTNKNQAVSMQQAQAGAVQLTKPGADHVDLYDRTDKIPFDKLADFFSKNLK
jgi:hypothetical protein